MNVPINFNFVPLVRSPSKPVQTGPAKGVDSGFRQIFEQAMGEKTLNISAHAEKRLQERNIALDPSTRKMLMETMDELSVKGAKDSLVITGNAAFVLNVPSRTLVTAMDLSENQNRIITQVDSVALRNIPGRTK